MLRPVVSALSVLFLCASCESGGSSPPAVTDAAVTDAGTAADVEGPPSSCVPLQPGSPHLATPPIPYTRRRNTVAETTENAARAQQIFAQECVRCHGATGKGDGADGTGLTPPPADFTARAHFDDYLFWRIAEGGLGDPTCSAMPSFKDKFTEEERWTLVRHVQRFSKPDGG